MKDSGTALVKYDAAITALAECVRVDEAKGLQDKAAAAQAYARQAKDNQLLVYATEIRMRAQRRVGELLLQMGARGERAKSGRVKGAKSIGGGQGRGRKGSKTSRSESGIKTLADLGLTYEQSHIWQRLAKLPATKFEEKVAVASGKKPKPKRGSKPPRKSAAKRSKQSDGCSSKYGGTSACDYNWSKPDPEHFKDTNEMLGVQTENYCHEAVHLAQAFPLLSDGVTKKLLIAGIESAQKVADAWLSLVADLKSRAQEREK